MLYLTYALVVLGSLLQLCDAAVCDDPFRCRLNSIVVSVPDFCLSDPDICVSNFSCHNLDLDAIPSGYSSPAMLEVGLAGLNALCAFDYEYRYGRLIEGSVTASVSNVDFLVDFLVGRDEAEYFPVSTSFSLCELTSIDVDITFDSSGLNQIAPILERATKAAIDRVLCVKTADYFAVNVTNFIIETLDPNLAGIVASQPSPLPQYDPRYYLSWSDSVVGRLHEVVDRVKGLSSGGEVLSCMIKSASRREAAPGGPKKLFGVDGLDSVHIDTKSLGLVVHLASSNMTVEVTAIDLSGLDTLLDLQVMEPMKESNVSLHSFVSFAGVSAALRATVNVSAPGAEITYSEDVVLRVELEQLSALLDIAVAVNQFVLDSFFLDQLATSSCWLTVLSEFSIANVQLHTVVKTVRLEQVAGSAGALEADVVALINNGLLLVVDGFAALLTDTLNGVMQGPLRAAINDRVSRGIREAKATQPCLSHYPYSDAADYVVWSSSTLVTLLSSLIDEKIGAAGANQLMNCLTNYTGVLSLQMPRMELQVGGLNSFYDIDVLSSSPDEGKQYALGNKIAAGYCPPEEPALCNPLRLIVSALEVDEDGSVLTAMVSEALRQVHFNMEVSLTNLEGVLDLVWKMDRNGWRDLTVGQLSTSGCTGSTVSSLFIDQFRLSADQSSLVFNGYRYNVTELVDAVLKGLSESGFVDSRNQAMAQKLSESEQTCRANGVAPAVKTKDEADDHDSSLTVLQISLIAVGSFLSLLVTVVIYFGYLRRAPGGEDLPWWRKKVDFSTALLWHEDFPAWLRFGFPVIVLCTFALFVYSDLQNIAIANMEIITPDGVVHDIGEVYSFKFGVISQDMWDAKTYALDILMVALSGVWPNIKLFVMMVCWVTPLDALTSASRERILLMIDFLGKWSLVDFFVMILLLCAFYFSMTFGQNLHVNVTMQPQFGFYGFLFATLTSQIMGHVQLSCHRSTLEEYKLQAARTAEEAEAEEVTGDKESLSSLQFEMHMSSEESASLAVPAPAPEETVVGGGHRTMVKVGLTRSGSCFVVFAILLTAVLLVFGTYLLVMTFEFRGAVGWILKEDAVEHYSYINMGQALPTHSGTPHFVGIYWFQTVYFMFGIGMPALLLISSLVLWLMPMSVVNQQRLVVAVEVMNSWSALDVYSVSIIAALFEIQQFAAFMIGDSCDRINVFLKHFDEQLKGDDKCFDVVAMLLPNAWVVFLAAVSINYVGVVTLSLSDLSVKQRMQASRQSVREQGAEQTSLLDVKSAVEGSGYAELPQDDQKLSPPVGGAKPRPAPETDAWMSRRVHMAVLSIFHKLSFVKLARGDVIVR